MPSPARSDLLGALERDDAAALGQSPEHVARAKALLSNDDPSDAAGLPEALLELVVFHAAENRRAAFLARASVGPKVLARLAKKELYRLKSEGKALELPRVDGGPQPKEKSGEALAAFLSPVDVHGRRTCIAPTEDVRHGFGAFLVELSDVDGVRRVELAPMPRREYRKFARELSRPEGGDPPWMELSLEELGGYIAAAVDLNVKRGTMEQHIRNLARAVPGEAKPAASRTWPVKDENVERELLHAGSKLFAEIELAGWMPPNEALALLGQRIDEVATSRLVVDEAQRRQQLENALDRTAADHFDRATRDLWAERLFRQADYFDHTGRRPLCDLASATARALASDRPIAEIPFTRVLFQKALLEQTEAALDRLPHDVREKLMAEERAAAEKAKQQPQGSEPLIVPGR
ncbi:MAG: hypothetical protein JST54_32270 [Deltaproteobacteria bacterium]|nr:hypothetical protein [Deltaproteobacteria bacterium]